MDNIPFTLWTLRYSAPALVFSPAQSALVEPGKVSRMYFDWLCAAGEMLGYSYTMGNPELNLFWRVGCRQRYLMGRRSA